MSPEERQMLTSLFDRVRTASATPRDRDAEALIEQQVREQPYATYYLTQAVIVQEKGLEAASNRIKDLEEQVRQLEQQAVGQPAPAQQSGGFLSSIFGSSQPAQQRPAPQGGPWGGAAQQGYQRGYDDNYRAPPPPQQGYGSGPWGGAPQQQAAPSAGGSFLRGALGTAAGVAGGMLLADTLSSAFSHHTSALGLGSPFGEASNPFGTPTPPAEETTIVNNYYGDDAMKNASDNDGGNAFGNGGNDNGGWQQADWAGGDDNSDQSDFGGGDFGGNNDDSMNV